jgi:hypothetical protein
MDRQIVYTKDLRSGSTLPFIPSPQGRGKEREGLPSREGETVGNIPSKINTLSLEGRGLGEGE